MTKAEESWCHALDLDANLKCLRSVIGLLEMPEICDFSVSGD